MDLLDQLVHFISAIILIALAVKAKQVTSNTHHDAYSKSKKVHISFLIMLAVGLIFKGFADNNWLSPELELLFWRLSLYVILPMMYLYLAAHINSKPITLDYWGRVFLGLCAGFELSRQANFLDNYVWVILGLQAIAVGFIFLKIVRLTSNQARQHYAALGVITLCIPLQLLLVQSQYLWLILFIPLLAFAYLSLVSKNFSLE